MLRSYQCYDRPTLLSNVCLILALMHTLWSTVTELSPKLAHTTSKYLAPSPSHQPKWVPGQLYWSLLDMLWSYQWYDRPTLLSNVCLILALLHTLWSIVTELSPDWLTQPPNIWLVETCLNHRFHSVNKLFGDLIHDVMYLHVNMLINERSCHY